MPGDITSTASRIQQYHTDHTHKDPSFTIGPTQKCHPSPSTILTVDEALRIINHQTSEPVAVEASVTASIIGSVIAEDFYSAGKLPAYHMSAVNGYAVTEEEGKVSKGGYQDAYIVERCKLLSRGDAISSVGGAISLLAMANTRTMKIFKKPRVGILGINNSIIGSSRQIGDASRLALISGLVSSGFEFEDLGVAHGISHEKLEHTFCAQADLILIINDAMINNSDLKASLERTPGGFIHFEQVHMKPSRHTMFATVHATATETTLTGRTLRPIFSLPNDPISALVAFNLFVLPSLNKMSGLNEKYRNITPMKPWALPQLGLPWVAVVLTHHIPLDPQTTEYHLATVTGSRSDARLYVTITNVANSSSDDWLVGRCINANALVILPAGRGVGIKGEIVEALLMGPVIGSDVRLIC